MNVDFEFGGAVSSASMTLKTCPHCGKSLKPPKPARIPGDDWRPKLGKFLAYFAGEITPIPSQRLVNTGIVLRIWLSQPAGYRRLNQMQAEGWLESGGHGFYILTDRGHEVAKAYASQGVPEVEGLLPLKPVTQPPTPDRRNEEDQVPKPSEWQIFFMKELATTYPTTLVGLQPVIRYTRKSGFLAPGGTAQIRALVADGWLMWAENQRLVLSPSGRKLLESLGEIPAVDRTPGVND